MTSHGAKDIKDGQKAKGCRDRYKDGRARGSILAGLGPSLINTNELIAETNKRVVHEQLKAPCTGIGFSCKSSGKRAETLKSVLFKSQAVCEGFRACNGLSGKAKKCWTSKNCGGQSVGTKCKGALECKVDAPTKCAKSPTCAALHDEQQKSVFCKDTRMCKAVDGVTSCFPSHLCDGTA